jgi:hypothetical protein
MENIEIYDIYGKSVGAGLKPALTTTNEMVIDIIIL